ncbi:MAG: SDR family oxidoreductase [Roseiflexaceae bacterium]|nr:SDR family oxidoreductase [Roseiflexaceae bacterium]
MASGFYLVTGASSGIGTATALMLAESGATIGIHYHRSSEAAQRVAAQVQAKGAKPVLIQADLASEEGCRSVIEQLGRETDTLDALINNAGDLVKRYPASELEWQLMEDMFRLNVFAVLLLSSLAIPFLARSKNNPCIINITSVGVRTGSPSSTIYGASKGAIDTFTRGLARELAPKGIRVNAVAPGVTETPQHERLSTPEQMQAWKNNTPLGRHGTPQDIAHAIQFLIANTFITGETLDVNGGLSMR